MFRRAGSGHSPSTRPASCTSSKSPKRALHASTRCTPESPARGANVCTSIQRRISAATTSLSTGVSSKRAQASRSATSVPRIAPRARGARDRP